MQVRAIRRVVAGAAVLATVAAFAGCGNQKGQGNDSDSGSSKKGTELKIALLLPESKTTRYESQDRPEFEKKVKKLDSQAKVVYNNANQKASQQQQQVQAALTDHADVIVLDPVDASALGSVLKKAKSRKVPVVAYDRFFKDADYYTSFDNEKIGELQGEAVLKGLKKAGHKPDAGPTWMVNGDPKDPNAADFKKGAKKKLKSGGADIEKSHDALDWNPDDARKWVSGQLKSAKKKPNAIYSANDGTAGGVISAVDKAGVKPVVTGQDGEVDGLQNILKGSQYATIYKSYAPQAKYAAEAAVKLAKGDKPDAKDTYKDTPTDFVKANIITKDNIKDAFADNQVKTSKVCTKKLKKRCAEAGLKDSSD